VKLNGIRVGRKIVDIPRSALAFNPTTGAGTIFDSGNASPITLSSILMKHSLS
jgi:hypothetical protein